MIINLGALEYMYIRSHLNSFSNSPTFIRLRRASTLSQTIKTTPIGKIKTNRDIQ